MIRRVRITNYKSLRNVEIELKPLTVFLGPNAAGKSNLFDAMGLFSRMATEKSLQAAFGPHRGAPLEAFYYGDRGLEGLIAAKQVQFTMEMDVELSPSVMEDVGRRVRQMREGLTRQARQAVIERHLRYTLTIEMMTDSGHLRVQNEQLTALNRDGTVRRSRNPFIERANGRLHLRMEGQAHPTYHDIGMDHTLVSTDLYAPHYPHITALKEELSRWRFYYLEPRAMRADTPIKEVDALESSGTDLAAFYNTLRAKNPRQFQAVERALRRLLPTVQSLNVAPDRQGMLQLQVIEAEVPFSIRVISEGTLRILALLAIVSPLADTTVIGYEEPENGVHPRRLRLIADLLENITSDSAGERQVLINTHSPILPSYFDDKTLVVCRRQGGETTFEPFRTIGPLFRNGAISQALEDQEERLPLEFAERVIRGDLDG
jgi:predicted ATPase